MNRTEQTTNPLRVATATTAPPRSVMNSRRFSVPSRSGRASYSLFHHPAGPRAPLKMNVNDWPNVRLGSKCEILRASRCFPVRLQTRTLLGAIGTSRSYHNRTHATQRRWPHSITSSARASRVGGTSRRASGPLVDLWLVRTSSIAGPNRGSTSV
jgi:hypothetical protein